MREEAHRDNKARDAQEEENDSSGLHARTQPNGGHATRENLEDDDHSQQNQAEGEEDECGKAGSAVLKSVVAVSVQVSAAPSSCGGGRDKQRQSHANEREVQARNHNNHGAGLVACRLASGFIHVASSTANESPRKKGQSGR